jgi:mannose-6-phosphate isomerase
MVNAGESLHTHGPNEIFNGPLKGITLNEAWVNHLELFSNQSGEEFSLLI